MIEHKRVFIGSLQLRLLLLSKGKVFLSLYSSAIGELLPLLMCQIRERVCVFRTYQ